MRGINEDKLKVGILSGGLSLAILLTGFGLGKSDFKNNNKYNGVAINCEEGIFNKINNIPELSNKKIVSECLNEYIIKRDELEQEIDKLLEQKQQLQNVKTFNIEDLTVIENASINNKPNLYILYNYGATDIYTEYHDTFSAWYRLHPDTEEHAHAICPKYIHFNEGQPLFNYLSDDEIEKLAINGGIFTTLELDDILIRIREEYQKQITESNYSLNLTID